MGTDTLAFANFLLILQLVSAAPSGYPAGPQLEGWNGVENDRQGTANTKYYLMQEKPPMSEGGITTDPTYSNLDDVNEMEFPPPPTQKDAPADTSFEDNNDIRGTSEYSNPTARNVLSGAGHLGTNEIIKFTNALPDIDPQITSNNNNYGKKDEVNEEQVPAGNKQYSYPELDEAVENAVNNLPSFDESPLVPLIKILNERKHEKVDENMKPEDQAWEKFYQNHLILKLANKAQKQKEENDNHTENQNTQESVFQELQERDKSSLFKNQNGANEEQPCDCEGGCDETPQVETTLDQMTTEKEGFGEEPPKDRPVPEESECGEETEQDHIQAGETLEQESQPGDDYNQINNRHPKAIAHIIVMLRRPEIEEKETIRNPVLMPITSVGRFRPRENPPLENMFLRVITKSNSMTIIPSSSFERNNDYSRHEQEITSTPKGECGDNNNENESDQENQRSSLPRVESDESVIGSSEYRKRASFTRYPSDDQGLSFQNKEVVKQTLPKEQFLLKVLINIMKQKAAANALKEMQGKQAHPLPTFEDSANTPQISKLVIIRPTNTLAPPQLPPLHFPDENAGYKIKHLEDYRGLPIFRKPKEADKNTESEPIIRVKTLNQSQEDTNSDGFAQQNSNHEEIPWFIRNILANLSGPTVRGLQPTPFLSGPAVRGLQPTPFPLAPVQKSAEEKGSVLVRALLAPYSL